MEAQVDGEAVIFHVAMDAYYASVEERRVPLASASAFFPGRREQKHRQLGLTTLAGCEP